MGAEWDLGPIDGMGYWISLLTFILTEFLGIRDAKDGKNDQQLSGLCFVCLPTDTTNIFPGDVWADSWWHLAFLRYR